MAEHELKLIAYILSDGSAQSSVTVTSSTPEIEKDLAEIAKEFKMQLRIYSKRNNRAKQYRFTQPRGQRAAARKAVAAALNRVQANRGMKWAAWARAAGVPASMLYVWAHGECCPGATRLEMLARSARASVGDLSLDPRDRAE